MGKALADSMLSIQYQCASINRTVPVPLFLMFWQRAQMPLDLVFKTDVSPQMTTPEYAVELKRNLEAALEKVGQTTGAKQEVQRRLYNRRVYVNMHQVGDHIWLNTTVLSRGSTKKLHYLWTGPYRVIKRPLDSTYRIQLLWAPHKRLVAHFNRWKSCGDAPEGSLPAEDTSVNFCERY